MLLSCFPPSVLLLQSLYCLHISFLSLPFFNPMTSIIPPSHPASLFPPPPSLHFSCAAIPLSFPPFSNCPPLSGDLAEAKCFLLSLCRWDCNKACQWEVWVALSHALCLPSVNSLLHLPPTIPPSPANPPPVHHSLPRSSAFISPLSFVCLFFPISSCSYTKPCSLTCLSCLSLSLWFPCQRHFQEHDEEEQQQKTPLLI